MSPLEVVQSQFDAYNARDAEKLASYYSENCVIADMDGAVTIQGRAAFKERFAKTFAEHPENRAWSINRIAVGDYVVNHEVGERAPGGERFEIVAIYTVKNGLITRLAMGK